ncbi:hypothetical protein [Bartonella sp. DGB2]|uniref:glycine-rich domain-containing protein n=1 Tax=Bartonella sp. DGB2 TaxID=3388426 RepID=UPI0039902778
MLKMQLKGLLPPDEEIEIFESKTVLWPAEVTDDSFIEVWAWGGGGSGGKDGSGGGGGGCGVAKYLRKDLPTPLNVIVGKGSNGSFNGGSTFFDRHLFASGGTSGDCPSGGGSGGPILSRISTEAISVAMGEKQISMERDMEGMAFLLFMGAEVVEAMVINKAVMGGIVFMGAEVVALHKVVGVVHLNLAAAAENMDLMAR